MIHYTIPGKPVTKKNSSRIIRINGHPSIVPSKQFVQYQRNARLSLLPAPAEPIAGPVNIKVIYFLPFNKDGSIPKNCGDLCNYLEATCDILVYFGIIEDDKATIVVGHDGSRVVFTKEQPHTEIFIEEVPTWAAAWDASLEN